MKTLYISDADRDLAGRVAGCLIEADARGLTDAGIFLDRALVALSGTGLLPAQSETNDDFAVLHAVCARQ